MLRKRGPHPTLREETLLTLKVMDDMAVPSTTQPQPDSYGLMQDSRARKRPSRRRPPATITEPETTAYAPTDEAQPAPDQEAVPLPAPYTYAPPPPTPKHAYAPAVIVPATFAYYPVVVMPATAIYS
jgi:hypothetical protein